ncbi:hypothetical protein PSP6_250121 [Paraburkholderia tropica]|nr:MULTISPECIES: hypothetical protein [Paraburkholderia]CAG9206415.1 hypothetical protein PSP6_250121 [Paraburkholderia tropica]
MSPVQLVDLSRLSAVPTAHAPARTPAISFAIAFVLRILRK